MTPIVSASTTIITITNGSSDHGSSVQTIIVSAVVTAIATSFTSYWFTVRKERLLRSEKDKASTYARIHGLIYHFLQLMVSRFEARIFSDYHERALQLKNGSSQVDEREASRWMLKAEDLTVILSESRKELFELLGTARALFNKDKKIKEKIDAIIENWKTMTTPNPQSVSTLAALETWKNQLIDSLQTTAEDQYLKPVKELLEMMKNKI